MGQGAARPFRAFFGGGGGLGGGGGERARAGGGRGEGSLIAPSIFPIPLHFTQVLCPRYTPAMTTVPINHQIEAVGLYNLTKDPLVLSAIGVLSDPDHPHYDDACTMIERMVDARDTLFPPE